MENDGVIFSKLWEVFEVVIIIFVVLMLVVFFDVLMWVGGVEIVVDILVFGVKMEEVFRVLVVVFVFIVFFVVRFVSWDM